MARSLQVFPVPGFSKGLNLRDKSDAVDPSEAIDALNVEFSERGAMRQRTGYTNLTSSGLTNRAASLEPFYTTGGTSQIVAGCGTRLEAVDTAGAVVASDTGNTAGSIPWDFARFGTPGNEYMYAGNGSNNLHRWTGSAWSDLGAGSPEASALCVTPWDNRLVAAGFTSTTGGPAGGTTNPSYIHFSDEGAPETWTANSFAQLRPGDGERIQAVIAWREFVFAFKQSSFFVFTGTTTDGSGNPVFERYPIDTGHGLVSPRAVCADETGVYFLDRQGIYRTTGREPVKISDLVSPIFDGNSSPFYLGGELLDSQITNSVMCSHRGRIYLAFTITGTANTRVLVYDTRFEWTSLYDLPAAAMCSFRVSGDEELIFARSSGTNHLDRHNLSQTNDAGSAITSRWRSGWDDFGDPAEKRLRWTMCWGNGKPKISTSVDFEQSTGLLEELDLTDPDAPTWNSETWNTSTWASPVGLVEGLNNRSAAGVVLSQTFSNDVLDQSWALHRLERHIAGVAAPSAISVP